MSALVCRVATATIIALMPLSAAAQSTQIIQLANSGAFNKQVTIVDNVCGTTQNAALAAGSVISVQLCFNSSGYANMTVSGVNTESGNQLAPVNYGLISPGETKTY